jgi:hypothetical protein
MAKSREELMQYASREYREVDGVRLRSLTELEMSELRTLWGERYNRTKELDLAMRRELLVASIVDDQGELIFEEDEADLLTDWRSKATERLYRAARDMNGMDEDEVDDLEKKSEPTSASA